MMEMVVDKITGEDLRNLKDCIEKHGRGLMKRVFPAEGDMLFHKTLAQATHNKMFLQLFDDIYLIIMESVINVKNYKKEYKEALIFHERIYESLLKKDKNSAKEAMKEHIEWLIKIISNSSDKSW